MKPKAQIRFRERADTFSVDPKYVTTEVPKMLWIELTSKCPFDCVFCTRRVRFGTGQNLSFDVFERVIAELDAPDFIGLNYSGESMYYPRLLDAIALAKSTGAFTELVTAFSTISKPLLQGIVESGLDRLAVSLHTMDPEQYRSIYRFGSLDLLKQRVADFFELRGASGSLRPRLDFCFVAMNENLDQLPHVVAYAQSVGVPEVSIHPLIGRHLVPHDFSKELQANRLRDEFKDALRSTIADVESRHPGFPINVLNPDLDTDRTLSRIPQYFAPSLPSDARIYSCDQSPFESVHILASGNVVVCEVHDEVSLGNLHSQSLREIWQGDAYRAFRQKYVVAEIPQCRSCVWKFAYVPGEWKASIDASHGASPQLLLGWHPYDASGSVWSKKRSVLALTSPRAKTHMRLRGALPHDPDSDVNQLSIKCNRVPIGSVRNTGTTFLNFDQTFALADSEPVKHFEFMVEHLYRPYLQAASKDGRDLGFALHRIELR